MNQADGTRADAFRRQICDVRREANEIINARGSFAYANDRSVFSLYHKNTPLSLRFVRVPIGLAILVIDDVRDLVCVFR